MASPPAGSMPGHSSADVHEHVLRGAPSTSTPSDAATGLWAATSPLLAGRGRLYLEDCEVARVSGPDKPMDNGGVRAYAIAPDAAEHLWEWSLAATGTAPIPR